MTATGWQGNEAAGEPLFDIAMRGYDRRQVEDRLDELAAQLAAADDALQQSRMQTDELGEQLRAAVERLRQAGTGTAQKNSFGFRVEKILRMAEEEAKELRAHATADGNAIVEQARAEAAARLADSERVRAEARRDADQVRANANANAADLTARVEADLTRRQQAVERELDRLVTARDQVRAELARMREQLRSVVPSWPQYAAGEPAEAGPVEGAGPSYRWRDPGAGHGAIDQTDRTQLVVPEQAGERPSRHRLPPRHTSMSRGVGGGVD